MPIAMRRFLVGGILVAALAVVVLLLGGQSQAQAATWHTVKAGANHHSRTYSITLGPSHPTRLKYWTAKVWDADDDGGEWEYDWVKFRLTCRYTGAVVKRVGPLYSPTGYLNWHTAGISVPSGVRNCTFKVTCDDARWGFKLQQKY
jgi:hypothetical protein